MDTYSVWVWYTYRDGKGKWQQICYPREIMHRMRGESDESLLARAVIAFEQAKARGGVPMNETFGHLVSHLNQRKIKNDN